MDITDRIIKKAMTAFGLQVKAQSAGRKVAAWKNLN